MIEDSFILYKHPSGKLQDLFNRVVRIGRIPGQFVHLARKGDTHVHVIGSRRFGLRPLPGQCSVVQAELFTGNVIGNRIDDGADPCIGSEPVRFDQCVTHGITPDPERSYGAVV